MREGLFKNETITKGLRGLLMVFALLLMPLGVWGEDYVLISNYAELKAFAAQVNSGHPGLKAKLTADIVCKNDPDDEEYDQTWVPIGDDDSPYEGKFLGQGYTITGLSNANATKLPKYAGMFGSIWKAYLMPSDNILQNTLDMMRHEGEVGYATNGYKVVDWLVSQNLVMDKVMLFTDCQLWNSGWGDASLSHSWNRYKEMAPQAKLYLFDLAGYGQSPVSMVRDDVFCIAGWSDKVFDILAALERGNSAIDEIRRIII